MTVVGDDSSGWTSGETEVRGATYDDFGRPLTGSSVTFGVPAAEDRFATQTIGSAEAPPPPRPRRVGKRDILLYGARLDNALRLLAREGRFNLVVQGDLADNVTLELRGVEPYDAALALAEANHLRLSYENGIVIAGRGNDKP